jgi:hypothetical protein
MTLWINGVVLLTNRHLLSKWATVRINNGRGI